MIIEKEMKNKIPKAEYKRITKFSKSENVHLLSKDIERTQQYFPFTERTLLEY